MEPSRTAPPSPDLDPGSSPGQALVERVRGLTPVVRGLVGKVRAVGVVSAVAAVVLWAVLFGAMAWPLTDQSLIAFVALGVLFVPAAGTFVAVLTLREVLALPDRLRALPGTLRETATDVKDRATSVAGSAEGQSRGRRALGFFGVLWRLRGIVEETRGSWLRTLALARFARLASLPFFLWLLGAFALNFVVIAAAAVAVLVAALW